MNEITRYQSKTPAPLEITNLMVAVLRKPEALAQFEAEVRPCVALLRRLWDLRNILTPSHELEPAVQEGNAYLASAEYRALQRYVQQAETLASDVEIYAYIGRLVARVPNLDAAQRKVVCDDMLEDVRDVRPTIAALDRACRATRNKTQWLDQPAFMAELVAAKIEIDGVLLPITKLPAEVVQRGRQLAWRKIEERCGVAFEAFKYRSEIPPPEFEDGVRTLYDLGHGAGAYDRDKLIKIARRAEEERARAALEVRKALVAQAMPAARTRFDAARDKWRAAVEAAKAGAAHWSSVIEGAPVFQTFIDEEVAKLKAAGGA
jgi:hypothetical protein